MLGVDADHGDDLFEAGHESGVKPIEGVVLGNGGDGVENGFEHDVVHAGETVFEHFAQ